ncbi:MAG TPA: hypothetical protein VM681_10220 [Candidatus Thermoplasmatota archaeon]|nr:hypothetical protein [Candidatus Thermoplasmatota archaeon]
MTIAVALALPSLILAAASQVDLGPQELPSLVESRDSTTCTLVLGTPGGTTTKGQCRLPEIQNPSDRSKVLPAEGAVRLEWKPNHAFNDRLALVFVAGEYKGLGQSRVVERVEGTAPFFEARVPLGAEAVYARESSSGIVVDQQVTMVLVRQVPR